MKIAMIGHKRIPSREGGVEIVVEELSTRLVKNGYQVDVYNRKGKNVQDKNVDKDKAGLKEYKGIKLITIPTINKKGIDALLYSFFATIRALFGKYDVIHYHAEGPCAMLWIPHIFGIKTVATIHGLDWQRSKWGGFATKYIKFGEKIAAKYADEIIVLSKGVQKYFKDTYNRDTNFIPNGVNKTEIKEANIIKEKWGLEKDNYILFLARIVPEKGLHYLIDAYKQITTDKKLVIAGGASHTNDYLEKIKKMVKDDNRIIMTGFVQGKELEELYSNCYLYCLPSDVEGMPISLLEAMSYGCNCLVSNIEENLQVTEKYATTFEKGNVKDLKEKLQSNLKKDNKLKKEEISRYIVEKNNWDNVVEQTEEKYIKNNKKEKILYNIYAYFLLMVPILITLDKFIKISGTLLTAIPFMLGLILVLVYQKNKRIKYGIILTLLTVNALLIENAILNFELMKPLLIFFVNFDLVQNKEFLDSITKIFKKHIKFLNISLTIIVLLNIGLYFSNLGFSALDSDSWRISAFEGLYDDPHQAAYRFCTLIVYCIIILKNNLKIKIPNLILLFLMEFCLLMTGARTPTLLGIFLGIIAIRVIKDDIIGICTKYKKLSVLAIIVIVIVLIMLLPQTAFFKKMISTSERNFDNGRTILREGEWKYFLESNFKNKMIGNDINTIYELNQNALGAKIWCHNDIMQVLLQFGVLILGLYFYEYVESLYYLIKTYQKLIDKIIIILLYGVFIFVAFFNGFFFHPRFVISIPILIANYKGEK